MMATHAQLSGKAERILYWGGRVNKQVPETLACRGFWGISPPEKFEILKLENATFSILDEISKKLFYYKRSTCVARGRMFKISGVKSLVLH